ncbi:hypothetical protein [Halocatena salina]|uniref:Uncharacterized protein n=1 Tax=Halocatena salina TaxID=2934340 RepID=A0A8U0A6M5_9EURY|nr:hypothetical protein [Halocatena salina]UPM44664.1 hypothetical protein MW046_16635 [Halocatena salina]
MTTNEPAQANEQNEKIDGTSRRNILKLIGTASVATFGAGALTGTAAASDATPESATPEETATAQFSSEKKDESIDPAVAKAVNEAIASGCVEYIAPPVGPQVNIKPPCVYDAYADPWGYAWNLLVQYPTLDDCRTTASVATEIDAHRLGQYGEEISLQCSIAD